MQDNFCAATGPGVLITPKLDLQPVEGRLAMDRGTRRDTTMMLMTREDALAPDDTT